MTTRGRKKAIAEPAPPAHDPRDVETIERLQQRIQELGFQQLQRDLPAEETETESNVWDDGSEDVNPFGGGNFRFHGDEEEEYPFVNKHPSFKEEPIVWVEEESCPVYNTDNEEDADPVPKYDFDGAELRLPNLLMMIHIVGITFFVPSVLPRVSKCITFTEVDSSEIPLYRIMHQGKSTVGSEAQEEHAYLFVGASNVKVRLGVVLVIGGSVTWMGLCCGGNHDDEYLPGIN
ncbi:cyclic nucleotide-binding domain-containing protein [Tanacetum coccineum]